MLELINLKKSFAGSEILKGVCLDIAQGDFFSILGPSGCGKTTLLRLLAGFDTPDSGEILWKKENLSRVSAHRRPFNMVFQRYALFPHLNVERNVAFGPMVKGWDQHAIKTSVRDALRLVQMEAYAGRRIETLSGGQQQRVALARAIVNKPDVLLLDEPLSALDKKLREQMRIDLLGIHRNLGITFILVTHDQEEALTMSDKIAVMNLGRVEQFGSPEDIYRRPKTPFVADFIGAVNSFEHMGEKISLRPEEIQLSSQTFQDDGAFVTPIKARIQDILFKGPVTDYVLILQNGQTADTQVIAQASSSQNHNLESGQTVFVRWSRASGLNTRARPEA
jgi:spermidine/putrescine transport system ATP-binding protein